jgi:hypothetical protein
MKTDKHEKIESAEGCKIPLQRPCYAFDPADDFWSDEDFEDAVAAAIIACYESKIKKAKGSFPADRINEKRLRLFRKVGPYLPGKDRVIVNPDAFEYDIENDGVLKGGVVSFTKWGGQQRPGDYHGYFLTILFRRVKKVSKYWVVPCHGYLYEDIGYIMTNDGKVSGHRSFFVLSQDGTIRPCYQRVQSCNPITLRNEHLTTSPEKIADAARGAATAMQYAADKRYCWTITARENVALATLGCAQEEIKSLLYARDLPLTATGRKRPILHLVAAHKRRIKNGTDIDVGKFLRGSQIVHIGNTEFTVRPPVVDKVNLPKSQRFFRA